MGRAIVVTAYSAVTVAALAGRDQIRIPESTRCSRAISTSPVEGFVFSVKACEVAVPNADGSGF